MAGPLGRREPQDWRHVERFALAALPAYERPLGVPGVLGINWYSNFDSPELDGNVWWIGRSSSLGSIRGGHAICAKARGLDDLMGWYDFYNQGAEGACVGYSEARMQSLNNRRRYGARDLYLAAQVIDGFPDTPPEEGTSVRAGLEILRTQGAKRVYRGTMYVSDVREGISTYRWATSWDEVRSSLALLDSYDGVPLLNSWGRSYPHIVRITDEAGARVLNEGGEFAIVTDR
jgi:hypothetical protein